MLGFFITLVSSNDLGSKPPMLPSTSTVVLTPNVLRIYQRTPTFVSVIPAARPFSVRPKHTILYMHSDGTNNNASSSPLSPDTRIQPRDKVSLYAQLGPEQTLRAILDALRDNEQSGKFKDEGIDALYSFANVDVWSVQHNFFGSKMDLGQFERFKRVMITNPYGMLLQHKEREFLSSWRVDEKQFLGRFRVLDSLGETQAYFSALMSKNEIANGTSRWMIDKLLFECVEGVSRSQSSTNSTTP